MVEGEISPQGWDIPSVGMAGLLGELHYSSQHAILPVSKSSALWHHSSSCRRWSVIFYSSKVRVGDPWGWRQPMGSE